MPLPVPTHNRHHRVRFERFFPGSLKVPSHPFRIPEHVRDRIWDVYFSLKKTGSGLGLPTARRIAEEHGGSLVVETEVGKGTNFVLRLPLTVEPGPV